jgi:hypothetical protein
VKKLDCICLLAFGFAITGCGGSSNNGGGTGGRPTGSYNLTVTGSFKSGSTTLTHATKVMLVFNNPLASDPASSPLDKSSIRSSRVDDSDATYNFLQHCGLVGA